jgi:hypothetical protein
VLSSVGIRAEAVGHARIETFPKPPLLYKGLDANIRNRRRTT